MRHKDTKIFDKKHGFLAINQQESLFLNIIYDCKIIFFLNDYFSLIKTFWTPSNGQSIVLKFSAPYWNDFIVTLASRRTQTGFNKHIWEWSLDGIQYNPIVGALSVADTISTFQLKTIDLQNIESLNRIDNIFIRITLDGATSKSGNNRFDNITVHAQKCMSNTPSLTRHILICLTMRTDFSITSRMIPDIFYLPAQE